MKNLLHQIEDQSRHEDEENNGANNTPCNNPSFNKKKIKQTNK